MSALVVFRVLVVFPQMPFCIFAKTVLFDESLFCLPGRPMIRPVALLIEHASSIFKDLLRVIVGQSV